MKAIILAAGKGTRLKPLTDTRPKPLILIANKSILKWNLEALQGLVDEVVIVIGYKGEMIKEALGEKFGSLKISYAEQKEQKGTGHALQVCSEYVKGEKFVVLNGDDIFSKEDIKKCLKHNYCVLTKEVEDPQNFGSVELNDENLKSIHEKSKNPPSNLATVGLYVLDEAVCAIEAQLSERGEIEIVTLINKLVEQGAEVKVEQVTGYWYPVSYPWGIIEANKAVLEKVKGKREGKIEKGATLKGEVVIGKGTVIKAGSYIEGPVVIGEKCVVGPNCFIRAGTTVGNGCKVGNAVEIKNSVLFDGVSVGHLSYIGDSVIGEDSNLGAGTITANLRHDDKNIKVMVNGKLVESGRRKIGAIIGPQAHTGIHTSIYPGRVIPTKGDTLPGEVVK